MAAKGGRPLGVLAMTAKANGVQVSWTSSREKKTAGSPESVVAGECTDSGRTGGVNELRTTCEKEGATEGVRDAWRSPPGPTAAGVNPVGQVGGGGGRPPATFKKAAGGVGAEEPLIAGGELRKASSAGKRLPSRGGAARGSVVADGRASGELPAG